MSNPKSPARATQSHHLIFTQFLRREILAKHRNSVMGMAWVLVTPLLMLAVYTFVFVGVFKAKWPGMEAAGGWSYAMNLFAGLTIFNFFAEVVNRAPNLLLEQPNLVKKVVFPLPLLVAVQIAAALFNLLMSWLILLIGVALMGGLRLEALALPVALLPVLPLLFGLGLLLSALCIYIRDLAHLVNVGVNLLLFLSPVFYTSKSLPENLRWLLQMNPLSSVIENVRALLFNPPAFQWGAWTALFALGIVVSVLGHWVFKKLQPGFADVI